MAQSQGLQHWFKMAQKKQDSGFGKFVIGIIIFLVIVFAAIAYNLFYKEETTSSGKLTQAEIIKKESIPVEAKMEGDVQTVTLSWGRYNYYPQTIIAKEGIPLRITGDMNRLQGCFRSFMIPGFNVRKLFTYQDNVLEFTPDKKGTFAFACTMNMGTGKLIVE